MSDARVYEPQLRERLGTTAHFCEVVICRMISRVRAIPVEFGFIDLRSFGSQYFSLYRETRLGAFENILLLHSPYGSEQIVSCTIVRYFRSCPRSCFGSDHAAVEHREFPLLKRALPTQTKVDSGTSQSESGTSVNLSNCEFRHFVVILSISWCNLVLLSPRHHLCDRAKCCTSRRVF